MKPSEPSRTALVVARQRAAHQVLDHGSILYDPFAMKILGEEENDVLQFANEHPLASIGRLFTTARSRIAEDALARAVERGMRQVVILGAGLDTFALRNPHAARQICIYEVDHPATQTWKRQRLAEAQIPLPQWLIFVPVDFERDDIGEKLAAATFQQSSPAFFTWLGVVPYLTQDAIDRTLDSQQPEDTSRFPSCLHGSPVSMQRWQSNGAGLSLRHRRKVDRQAVSACTQHPTGLLPDIADALDPGLMVIALLARRTPSSTRGAHFCGLKVSSRNSF